MNKIWTLAYRPTKIDQCALPQDIKMMFSGFVNDHFIPNLVLAGSAGCGKTTSVLAMLTEIDADYFFINASKSGNIDTLRTDIQRFAETFSVKDGRKYVILDEADGMSDAMQKGLKAFIEEFGDNCGFILTCNNISDIIEPLRSRCTEINFKFPTSDKEILRSIFIYFREILRSENIEFDKNALGVIIQETYPDFRRCLNKLQCYAKKNSRIDAGIIGNEVDFQNLIKMLKSKNFSEIRQFSADNSEISQSYFFKNLYDNLEAYVDNIPELILIIAEYQYRSKFSVDNEINMTACLVEIMVNSKWK